MSCRSLKFLAFSQASAAFDLGLERTGGFETVGLCELNAHARRVLAKNFPGVPCHDDVTTYEFRDGEADVIAAGFPCQDISFAGLGAGLAGARSGLYREVVRALRVVRPIYALLENVAALLSRGLDTVLGDLAAVGYDAEWHCIPASAVGAPHRRDRIWIVANARGEQHEGGRPPLSGTLAEELSAANSYAAGERRPEAGGFRYDQSEEWSSGFREEVADTSGGGWSEGHQDARRGCAGTRETEERARFANGSWWTVEPGVGRVAHGVPSRVDRLAELGNAVVPQIPEVIGNAILQSRRAA